MLRLLLSIYKNSQWKNNFGCNKKIKQEQSAAKWRQIMLLDVVVSSSPVAVPWHSGNYRVLIHSETRTWHDKNMQSNAMHRWVLTTQLNHLNKWLWVRVQLQLLQFQISRLFRARSSLTFRQLQSVDSLWNAYVT